MLAMLMTLLVSGPPSLPTVAGSGGPPTVWIIDAQNIVPASGVATMRQEAYRIWSRYGVELQWSRRLPDESPVPMLVVLLHGTTDRRAPLGHVTRIGNTFRREIVVADAAIIDLLNASGSQKTDPAWVTLYSRMFARVLSHELGHLLLNSAAHSLDGLMRARFTSADVKSSADERFSLTAADATTIRSTVTAQLTLAAKR